MNKNSSNLYSKWVHPIFVIDSLPKAAWFYFNFSLIAKGASHVHHVPAAEKRLSEVKNAFNQSGASPAWGPRGCRAGAWMHKGKSHTKSTEKQSPQSCCCHNTRGMDRDREGWTGIDTEGHTGVASTGGTASMSCPRGRSGTADPAGPDPKGLLGSEWPQRAAQPWHWAGLAADLSLLPPVRKCSGVTCPEVLYLLLLLL